MKHNSNQKIVRIGITLVMAIGFYNKPLFAHGTLHEQIEHATKQIKQNPNNANHYYHRGESYRAHLELDLALADYEHAKRLDPKLLKVDLAKSKLFLQAKWHLTAKSLVDDYIMQKSKDPVARVVRAKLFLAFEQPQKSIDEYSMAIKLMRAPEPDLYLTRSKIVMTLDAKDTKLAISMIDAGIKRLGPLITFQLYAIELELLNKNYTSALARTEKIMKKANRKEKWLSQQGDILLLMGQPKKAKASYQQSLIHIDKLPYSRRNTATTTTLKQSLQDKLNALTKKP